MALYENIKLLCKENQISIRKLQEKLGFPKGTISNWQRALPSCGRILTIAEYFHVSTDFLLGISDDRRTSKKNGNAAVNRIIEAAERLEINDDIATVTISLMECMSKL